MRPLHGIKPYSKWTGSKQIIFDLVPVGSKVLDMGCGQGLIGDKLTAEKNCRVTGVDKTNWSGKAMTHDLNSLAEIVPLAEEEFDVMIFADSLEHLHEPERALAFYLRYLRQGGKLIISVPNVANWLNRINVLVGRWNYEQTGLCWSIEDDHLHYFNVREAVGVVERCGLKVERTLATSGLTDFDVRWGTKNPANFWKNFLGFQTIIEATRN